MERGEFGPVYVGSVRFFKNLILLAVIVLIAVPSAFALYFHGQVRGLRADVERLTVDVVSARQETIEAERAKGDAETSLQVMEAKSGFKLDTDGDGRADALPFEVPEYQSLLPDFYAPEAYHAVTSSPNTIFLTFDDGPTSATPGILKALDKLGVKATFFVTGKAAEAHPDILREIAAAGHTIGMHSYSHEYSTIYKSLESFLEDMYKVFAIVRDETGTAPTLFRCPGGSINGYNAGYYQAMLAEMARRGFVPCDWNLSAEDATGGNPSAEKMVQNVTKNTDWVKTGYVLIHDNGRDATAAALDGIVRTLRDRGFSFDRLTPDTKPVLFGYTD